MVRTLWFLSIPETSKTDWIKHLHTEPTGSKVMEWTKRPGCWSSVNPNTASYLHFSIEEHGHYLRSAAGLLDVIKGSPPYLFAKYHQSLLASSLSAMSASRAVSLSISQKFINYTQKHSSKQALVLQIPPPLINWV